jgi:membrane associated rhomboid family serine protease
MPISFLTFFVINIIIYFYSKIYPIETSKYIFQYISIIEKNQYYRVITRYFIHFGFFHLSLELTILFYLCKFSENMLGTLISLSLISVSMILISIIHLIIIPIISFIVNGRFPLLLNILYEGGLTPILFALLTYFSFFHHRDEEVTLEFIMVIKLKYSFILLLLILYAFTPNRTFLGNVSGIIGGIILKKYPKYFLPKVKWIKEMEEKYSLNKIRFLYRYINLNNNKMKDILKEFDEDSMNDIIKIVNINKNKNIRNKIEFPEIDDNM